MDGEAAHPSSRGTGQLHGSIQQAGNRAGSHQGVLRSRGTLARGDNVICFDKTICGDLESALAREWLETNGLGGFACGTVAGANTRRYHGLLTAALNPPGRRMLLLSKIEETLVVNDQRIDLSTNEYEGAVHPRGYSHLASFCINPLPTFTFEVERVRIEKSLFMVY